MDVFQNIREILFQRTHPLKFLKLDELPEDIPSWILRHGTDMEIVVMAGVFFCLMRRGAAPEHCARYAVDGTVELPFEGCEDRIVETILASMTANGHSALQIAQLIELLCIAGERSLNMMNQYASSDAAVVNAGKERARA